MTSYSRLTLGYDSFYPIKAVSRSVIRRRIRRFSRFAALGLAFTWVAFSPVFNSGTWVIAERAPAAAIAAFAPKTVAASLPEPAPVATLHEARRPARIYPLALALKVENGDTLSTLLTDAGVPNDEAQRAIQAIRPVYDARKLDIGQQVAITLDRNPESPDEPVISNLTLPISAVSTLSLSRQDGDFAVKKTSVPIERKLARAGGRIDNSLYETSLASGIPAALIQEIINAYSYDVDFQRDIQPGDGIDVLFEKLETDKGATAGHGNVLFAQLDLGGQAMKIYRYVDKSGHADYYNEKGESVRKALLRTPINGARISSGFGMRNHPILGYSKMHRGVDFAAATGTPIFAAGDGVVEMVGPKGGYGNYIRIKHNGTYSSAYAHISHFAAGMKPGRQVKQGQVIAYVGMTGMATGPHLHYEILVHNEQVNPANVKFKTGDILGGKELVAFKKNMKSIEAQLASVPHSGDKLAMNDAQ